jgi:hypothetical protein
MILRRVSRWLTPLGVLLFWAAVARADGESSSEHAPVMGYFLAFLFTLVSLVVVCMPSRKS